VHKNGTYYDNWPDCNHNVSTHYLYIAYTAFIISGNLLLLNLVIAIFNLYIENINNKKTKTRFLNSLSKYEALSKTILPPPLNLLEYLLVHILRAFHNYSYENSIQTNLGYLNGNVKEFEKIQKFTNEILEKNKIEKNGNSRKVNQKESSNAISNSSDSDSD